MSRQRILHLTIDDFTVQTFRAGGKGGQNQNKRDTGVRVIHPPSGARAESREHRTQKDNKRAAWLKCVNSPAFMGWLRVEHARALGQIEAAVDMAMRPENIDIAYYTPDDTA